MARPQKQISIEQIFRCSQRGMNKKQTAAFLGISEDTLQRRFAAEKSKKQFDEAWYTGKLKGDAQILDKLYENGVVKGKTSELLHLVKARVGLTEKPQASRVKVQHDMNITHSVAQVAAQGEDAIRERLAVLAPKIAALGAPKTIEGIVIPKRAAKKKAKR